MLPIPPVKNFAKIEVSIGYDADDVSIVLKTDDGAKLPDPSADGEFNLVWWNWTDYKDPSDDPNREIVKVTARSTDTLTIQRPVVGNNYNGEGSENTAQTHNTADKVYKMILAPTKDFFDQVVPTMLDGTTTDDTPAELESGIPITASSLFGFDIQVVAGDNISAKAWNFKGTIKRDGSDNTALGGAVNKTSFGEDDAAAAWDVNVTADDTAETLIVTVTGEAATTIKWKATISISKITF